MASFERGGFWFKMKMHHDWQHPDGGNVEATVRIVSIDEPEGPGTDTKLLESINSFRNDEDVRYILEDVFCGHRLGLGVDKVNGEKTGDCDDPMDAVKKYLVKHPGTRCFKLSGTIC